MMSLHSHLEVRQSFNVLIKKDITTEISLLDLIMFFLKKKLGILNPLG